MKKMKKISQHIGMFIGSALLLTGCETDADMTTMSQQGECRLTATATEADITLANYQTPVLQLVWTMPVWYSDNQERKAVGGLTSAIVQVSTDAEFATFVEQETIGMSKTFTAGNLNALAKSLKLETGRRTTLFFRIQCLAGGNIDVYSNVCNVAITPIYIEMKKLTVLDKNKQCSIGRLLSPEENGVYSGYMKASAWLNCWFEENDGAIWGNEGQAGHAFQLSQDATAWNCWFADPKGSSNHWHVTVDVNGKEWTARNVFGLQVNGEDMTFNTETSQWQGVIQLTEDELHFTARCKQFDKETTDVPETDKVIDVSLGAQDGQLIWGGVSKASVGMTGQVTVTVGIDSNDDYSYRVQAGSMIPEEEVFPLPTELIIYHQDKTSVLATLPLKGDGVYVGTLSVTEGWMKFWLRDETNDIFYGCPPEDARKGEISKATDSWNCWIDSETKGVYTIEANLKTKKWSATWKEDLPDSGPTMPEKLELFGDPDWSVVTATLTKTGDGIYEAVVTISADGNFKIVEGSTWYGCDPEDNSKLLSTERSWNLWMTAGTYTFKVDWRNMTWSATPKV